ncbi:MAG: glycosyltransferase family 2 protein [Actinobacteria bacterium]|nr:glycosyltransferase family 2 protein [Actinomycetota bacterium]
MNKEIKVLSVVLSFYNEENVIEELVNRLENVFKKDLKGVVSDHELILVNDASTDKSKEILIRLSKNNKSIKIVNMSRNFGVSPCVLAGMAFSSGDAVVYMDADLQDPPEVIPEMVKVWLNGDADIVDTRRVSRAGESKIKLLITKIGYLTLNKVSSVNIEPEVGDFKLLSRRAVNELIKLKEKKPFTRGLVRWIGFKQETIYYNRDARYAGETKFKVYGRKVISNFLDSALISFSSIPLKVSLFIGFLVSAGAFCFLIVIFIMKFLQLSLPGWSAIMATILMLGGIQLLTIGMLGLYINSIFLETKGRPNYIVESTHGFNE